MTKRKNLKDAFYSANFRVGQGLVTRDKSTDSNDLTESVFENIQTWDELTDQADTGEAFDELTDSEQGMDDSTESNFAMDVVTDKEPAMDKVTDKEMPMEKVMSKVMARDKFYNANHWVDKGILTRSQEVNETVLTESNWTQNVTFDQITDDNTNMDEMTDSEKSMDDATESEVAMDKVTDKEVAMDKVMSKVMARSKFLSSNELLNTLYTETSKTTLFWERNEDPEQSENFDSFPYDYPTPPHGGTATADIVSESPNEIDGGSLEIYIDPDDFNSNEKLVRKTYDLTDASELKVWIRDPEANEIVLWVDDNEEFQIDAGTSWQEETVDVSTYSGEVEIALGTNMDTTDDVIQFNGLRVIE